jgi:CubicO group peptidase (beta-lactamase class C family)
MKKSKRGLLAALFIALSAGPLQAQADTAEAVAQEWLAAFNSGDAAAIRKFYAERLGDPDAVYPIQNAEDTCGFDKVRVESRTAQSINVLLVEKCLPNLERLKIELGPPGEKKLKTFDLFPLKLPPERVNAALTDIADRLSARDKFAGAVIVAHGDKQWAHNWGNLDKSGARPITADTPMLLASAGKMFTAVSVLQLVDAGKIDLDAPLGRYLTDYPNKETARVTVRQLLEHRGGTGDIGILGKDDGANRAHVRTIADIIALNGNRPPDFSPGTKTDYSNYGFVLLGAIVERVSGESYYDYVAQHVFKPAGMTNAGFPDLEHLDGVATGYTTFYGKVPKPVSNRDTLPWRGMPAGGGVASANDMLKFFNAMKSGKLLSAKMLKLATTAGDTPWYGMGFVVASGENPSWGHGGQSYGMDVAAHYYPAEDTAFVCLATRDMACDRLMYDWYRRYFGWPK